jgi:hypothetical protein
MHGGERKILGIEFLANLSGIYKRELMEGNYDSNAA